MNHLPPLRRTCEACQRCARHCFRDPGCRMSLHREVCLTCSIAVFFVMGIDASRVWDDGKNVTKSRLAETPNRPDSRPGASLGDQPIAQPIRSGQGALSPAK
jgi:hypothetical protein